MPSTSHRPNTPKTTITLSQKQDITVALSSTNLHMDEYVNLCCSFGLPVWMASLLRAAKHHKREHVARRKFYRLLHNVLKFYKIGRDGEDVFQPTYVYPEEVKMLVHSVFPDGICNFPDPCHDRVVHLTVDDFHQVDRLGR